MARPAYKWSWPCIGSMGEFKQRARCHSDPSLGKAVHLFAPKKWSEADLTRAAEAREKIESLATMTIVDT